MKWAPRTGCSEPWRVQLQLSRSFALPIPDTFPPTVQSDPLKDS